MICPQCKDEGKKSQVYPGMSTITAMYFQPFYDEDGKYHNHDGNTITTSYSCSNGHRWVDSGHKECWCGWGKKDGDQHNTNDNVSGFHVTIDKLDADGLPPLQFTNNEGVSFGTLPKSKGD